ncbi:11559_t:CDS:1, partial [Cetraspora pellucida]
FGLSSEIGGSCSVRVQKASKILGSGSGSGPSSKEPGPNSN